MERPLPACHDGASLIGAAAPPVEAMVRHTDTSVLRRSGLVLFLALSLAACPAAAQSSSVDDAERAAERLLGSDREEEAFAAVKAGAIKVTPQGQPDTKQDVVAPELLAKELPSKAKAK